MFVLVDRGDSVGAYAVRGTDAFAGQTALFSGPGARDMAEA